MLLSAKSNEKSQKCKQIMRGRKDRNNSSFQSYK